MTHPTPTAGGGHTAGPWYVHGGNGGYGQDDTSRLHIRGHEDDYCLAVIISDVEELEVTAEANAHLIAAAPALLEALQIAMEWISRSPSFAWEEAWPADKARIEAALAQAKASSQAKEGERG